MNIKLKRKVREISGSLYISIPKYWSNSVGLIKDQEVSVELVDEHTLKMRIPGSEP